MSTRYLVDTHTLTFRLKVQWFVDILLHAPSRQYLWSLYYAGEAYEELHPNGMFIHKLEGTLAKHLDRQMRDEGRHATIFRGFLRDEGLEPAPLDPTEDMGWYLLSHIVPEAIQEGQKPGTFPTDLTVRYMAFLHVLELRSIYDLCALLTAARQLNLTKIVNGLESIVPDELFHASYTHQAVRRLEAQPRRMFDNTRRRERELYARAVNGILSRFEALGTAPRTLSGRIRWAVMGAMARLGLAFPLLPLFDRVPSRLMPGPYLRPVAKGVPA